MSHLGQQIDFLLGEIEDPVPRGEKMTAKAVRVPLLTASIPFSQACSGSFAVCAWYASTPVAISPASSLAAIQKALGHDRLGTL